MILRPAPRLSFAVAVLAFASVVSGCNCRGAGGLGASVAEIGVVWTDNGAEVVNRDAVYDFGTAFAGDRVNRKLIIRNVGTGTLHLVSIERVEGATVSIGDDVQADSAFDIRFTPGTDVESTIEYEADMFFTPRVGSDYSVKLTLTAEGTAKDATTATI